MQAWPVAAPPTVPSRPLSQNAPLPRVPRDLKGQPDWREVHLISMGGPSGKGPTLPQLVSRVKGEVKGRLQEAAPAQRSGKSAPGARLPSWPTPGGAEPDVSSLRTAGRTDPDTCTYLQKPETDAIPGEQERPNERL